MSRLALAPKARWMGRFTAAQLPAQGAQLHQLRAGDPARSNAADRCHAPPGQGVQRALPGRRRGRGQRVQALVPRLRRGRRRLARRAGLRARLDRHHQLPGQVPACGTRRDAARRRRRAVAAAQRDDLPGGHRVGLEVASWTASMLRRIGVAKVRGFMLNVTHHDWTANNIAYGRKVSRRIGGKPFVVSTSYNGRGPGALQAGQEGPLPARERVLQPALPRPRAQAQHQHRPVQGRRLPLPQPARGLRGGRLQRRQARGSGGPTAR